MCSNNIEILNEYAKEIGIEFSSEKLKQFYNYYELLVSWNEKMNLTSITEFNDVIIKHFIDSVAIVKGKENVSINELISGKEKTMIDVGCGAGFPSIPLKIAFPNLKITLLDSLNKRINFLNEVINDLMLENIFTVHGRAEDFAKDIHYREQFDFAVSRAVANLSTLSEYCLPYVKSNGYFIAYKSELNKEEIEPGKKAIYVLGGEIENVYEYTLPKTDYYRSLCVVKKSKVTPKKYPRKAGLPSKEPIGKTVSV